MFASNFPDLLPAIFSALDAESFSDTMIREKLLTLAETGDLEYLRMPDGSKTKIRWGLEHLVSRYFGLDIKEEKTDPGAWRLNFNLLDGKPAAVDEFMPLVLINPEIKPGGEPATGGEGCLSFPEIFAEITRPESVDVKALNQKGKPVEFRCGGLLARAIQHEVDHLNGILFIDRMSRETKEELRPELDDLQAKTKAELESAGKR